MNKNSTFVSINNKIVDLDNAKISIFDRGFLYGDSIYEVSYSKDRSILFLDEHLDRLYNSANLIGLPIHATRQEIKSSILDLLKASNINDAYFRIIVTRGENDMSLDPFTSSSNNTVIIVKPRPIYAASLYEDGIDLLLSNIIRNPKSATDPNAKSGNYLNNVLAIKEAKERNYSDAIMTNKEGELTEGTTFNIWFIKDNKVITPASRSGLLKGITRQKVLELKLDPFKIYETVIFEDDIHNFDEAFITSSTRGIMPVGKILMSKGEKSFFNFTKTKLISKAYDQLVHSHIEHSNHNY